MSTSKGKKKLKNVPELHSEVKVNCTITLTPTHWKRLKEHAKANGTSASEMIEQYIRNTIG